MTEGRPETRAEEVARVRSYLASQSLRRSPVQLVEAVREAHQQFLAALAAVPEAAFHTAPSAGEWSAADVLLHMQTIAAFDASAIPAVILRGEQPPDIEDRMTSAPSGVTRAELLSDLEAHRKQLLDVTAQADPETHLEITWGHPEFGQMHWREWLLFARVHTLDHARQVQAIAAAVAPGSGSGEHAGSD